MLSQPFSLARNCCPKEEREENFSKIVYYNEKKPLKAHFLNYTGNNEYGLNTFYFNYPELSDRYILKKGRVFNLLEITSYIIERIFYF